MRHLLWKEYRERRLWALPLAASVVGVVALGRGYTYCGEPGTFGNWFAFAALAGLLFGMSEFSGELAWGTPEFLFSRPVSWKRLVAAKLIFGLGLIAAAAILGAIVFRFTTPEPYRRFATLVDLAPGIGWAFLIMAVPYLLGAACSVLFPGSIGAILALVTIGAAFFGECALLFEQERFRESLPVVMALGWAIGLILATIVVVRFGLTLSIANRVKRFALVMIPVIAVATIADNALHSRAFQSRREVVGRWVSISPDSRFAVERTETRMHNPVHGDYEASRCVFIRLSDRKTVTIAAIDPAHQTSSQYDAACEAARGLWESDVEWTPNGTAYYLSKEYGPLDAKTNLHVTRYEVIGLRMTADGRLARSRVRSAWKDDQAQYAVPSPSGRLAAVSVSIGWSSQRPSERVDIIDVEHGVRLPVAIHGLGVRKRSGKNWSFHPGRFWWQSDSKIGYLDNNERRRIVRVTN